MMSLVDQWNELELHLAAKARGELERYLWDTAEFAYRGLTLRSFLESEVRGVDALDFTPLVDLITGLTPIGVLDLMVRFRDFSGGEGQLDRGCEGIELIQ